jgi:hypothetical protein
MTSQSPVSSASRSPTRSCIGRIRFSAGGRGSLVFSGRGLAKRQLNHPARRISLRSASAFVNSTLICDHASALQRVCSITRRTRLMRSQGC